MAWGHLDAGPEGDGLGRLHNHSQRLHVENGVPVFWGLGITYGAHTVKFTRGVLPLHAWEQSSVVAAESMPLEAPALSTPALTWWWSTGRQAQGRSPSSPQT